MASAAAGTAGDGAGPWEVTAGAAEGGTVKLGTGGPGGPGAAGIAGLIADMLAGPPPAPEGGVAPKPIPGGDVHAAAGGELPGRGGPPGLGGPPPPELPPAR